MSDEQNLDQVVPATAPIDTGADGGQTAQTTTDTLSLIATSRNSSQDQGHLGAVLGEHIYTRSPTAMAFAVAAFRDAEMSREILKDQMERLSDDRDLIRERFHDEVKTSAILSTQLKLTTKFKRFQRWAFGIGGILAGAGLGSAVQIGSLRFTDGLLVVAGLVVMWIGSSYHEGDA